MNPNIRPILAALGLIALMSTAQAQSQPLDPNAPQNPMAQGGGMGGGMMGMMAPSGGHMGMMNMGSMMPMMQQMMSMQGGRQMQPFEHVEGRIAFLHAELKITAAQEDKWNAFADALRHAAQGMQEMHAAMPPAQAQAPAPASWIDRLTMHESMLTAHSNAMKEVAGAAKPLYESFSAEQKQLADDLMSGPMGMM